MGAMKNYMMDVDGLVSKTSPEDVVAIIGELCRFREESGMAFVDSADDGHPELMELFANVLQDVAESMRGCRNRLEHSGHCRPLTGPYVLSRLIDSGYTQPTGNPAVDPH